MKHFSIFFLLFIFLITCPNKSHAQLSIDSCQAKARRNFPLIQQYGLIDQTTEFTLSNANKAFLPQLSFNIIGGVIDGFPSINAPGSNQGSSSDLQLISVVQLNQAIWDGGATKASKELAKANAEIEKADVDVTLYQIKERINNLYFGILLIDAQLQQNDIFFENLKRNAKSVQIAVENGTAYKSDLDEIKVELLNAEERTTELVYNKAVYCKVLSAMIGEPVSTEVIFKQPEKELLDLDTSIGRPELSLFANQKTLIDARSQLNKSALFPKIGVLGFGTFLTPGIEFGASDIDRILVAGLSVSWDIAGLYRNGNNKKIDELSLKRIQNQEETFLFNTNLQLNQTQVELQKYEELIRKTEEIVLIKERIKKAYEVKYENGVTTMTQLLDKTNEENLAKQKLIMQEIQYLQKQYQYKYKSGS